MIIEERVEEIRRAFEKEFNGIVTKVTKTEIGHYEIACLGLATGEISRFYDFFEKVQYEMGLGSGLPITITLDEV